MVPSSLAVIAKRPSPLMPNCPDRSRRKMRKFVGHLLETLEGTNSDPINDFIVIRVDCATYEPFVLFRLDWRSTG